MFATLARQALESSENIPEPLATAIEEADHDGERITDESKALDFLRQSIELLPAPVYLVFDGLDETSEPSQKIISNGLRQLLNDSSLRIKLFVTSRDEFGSALRIQLPVDFLRVPVSPTAIALDIDSYVRASTRCRIIQGLLVVQDQMLEELIVQELVKGAQGM